MPAAKTIEDCRKLAAEKGGKCLSTEYKNNHTDLFWECKYGHQFTSMYNNVQQGHWCSDCSDIKMKLLAKSKRNTIEDCRKLAIEKGGKCLSIEYKNNNTKMLWECRYGHRWWAKYNKIQQGSWCHNSECEKEKRKNTCLIKYGVEHHLQNKEILNKQKQTNLIVYGVECVIQNQKIKEKYKKTCLEKYGVDNPTKNKGIRLKAVRASNKTHHVVYWETGEILELEGWEDLAAEYWNKNKIRYITQKDFDCFTMPDGRTYTPDFYLPDQDLWIEVKGKWYNNSEEKWIWFHSEYPNSELWDEQKLKSFGINTRRYIYKRSQILIIP